MALPKRGQVRPRTPKYFRHIPYQHAERNARVLLNAIRSNLGQTTYFQREDLLQLPVFMHVTTISRYGHIRLAVLFLMQRGDLVQLSRTDLALPNQAKSYTATPLHEEYLDTIRLVVKRMAKNTPFSVMDVVAEWASDEHLSVNSKRVAVRHAITRLVEEHVCQKRDDYEYIV